MGSEQPQEIAAELRSVAFGGSSLCRAAADAIESLGAALHASERANAETELCLSSVQHSLAESERTVAALRAALEHAERSLQTALAKVESVAYVQHATDRWGAQKNISERRLVRWPDAVEAGVFLEGTLSVVRAALGGPAAAEWERRQKAEAFEQAINAVAACESASHTNTIFRGDAVTAIQRLAGPPAPSTSPP